MIAYALPVSTFGHFITEPVAEVARRSRFRNFAHPHLGIDEIARACHMCDRCYFSKRFKNLFGISSR